MKFQATVKTKTITIAEIKSDHHYWIYTIFNVS
jgi:hypothetical protein